MKTWAEKKRREMEAIGASELAEMFQTIVQLYELEEQLSVSRHSDEGRRLAPLTSESSRYATPHDLTQSEPAP